MTTSHHHIINTTLSYFQNIQDLDAYARDFYNEIRALSIDTGGSIENILDNIGASCESLSSLIPQEKRTVRPSN